MKRGRPVPCSATACAHQGGGSVVLSGWWRCIRVVLVLMLLVPAASADAQSVREADLKAAFLYNFLAFVEWPPEAFADERTPFVIGVLGGDSFHLVLENVVRGEHVGQRECKVRFIRRPEDVPGVHILFVGASESWRLDRVLQESRELPILTVGDSPDFARRGGIIEFRKEGDYLRLRINRERARDAGLRISSKLLQLAQVVGEPEVSS